MEDLAARTDVVLQFALEVQVVIVAVLDEIRVTSERLVANLAFDRGLASVDVAVFVVLLFGDEGFVACDTFIRFNTEVSLHVELHILATVEVLCANAAFKGVDFQVLCVAVFIGEDFAASSAHVPQVSHQIVNIQKVHDELPLVEQHRIAISTLQIGFQTQWIRAF